MAQNGVNVFQSITSRQNRHFKDWYGISQMNRGKKTNQVFLEGLRLCRDAAESGVLINAALINESAAQPIVDFVNALPGSVNKYRLPDALFKKLCQTDHPQGVALVCSSLAIHDLEQIPGRDGFYLVAQAIADPGNLGTLIRIADAFAFDAVITMEGSVWPMNPKVVRASMGSCFHVPIISGGSLESVLRWLKKANIQLVAADPEGDSDLSFETGRGAALLIGNEAHGLSREAQRQADIRVRIPMPGRAESLNAASAAAIMAYRITEKRKPFQIEDGSRLVKPEQRNSVKEGENICK
jgi:RNA methyltransferase, TrmH family